MNFQKLCAYAIAAVAVFGASAAMAATGTSDAATSFDGITTAVEDWFGGSGGRLIAIAGVIIGGVTMLWRPSWLVFGSTVGVALLVGYGIPAMTSLASISAPIPHTLSAAADIALAIPAAL